MKNDITFRRTSAIVFCYFLGYVGYPLMPFWVGAVTRSWGVEPYEIGLVVSLQLLGGALASIYISLFGKSLNIDRILMAGIIVMIVGNFVSVPVVLLAKEPDLMQLGFVRFLSGCGEGAVIASMNAIIARSGQSHKLFSKGFMALAGSGFIIFLTIPPLIELSEANGLSGAAPIFLFISAVALVGLLFGGRVKSLAATQTNGSGENGAGGDGQIAEAPELGWRGYLPAFAIAILFMGFVSIYSFIERIAAAGGLSPAELGYIKAAGVALTIAGPTIAGILGTRFGHLRPMIAGLVIIMIADISLSASPFLWNGMTFLVVYSASLVTHEMLSLFIFVYAAALTASLDPSGRLSAAVPAFQNLGASLGPVAGGAMIAVAGFPGLGWLSSSLYMAFILVLMTVLRSSQRTRNRAPV